MDRKDLDTIFDKIWGNPLVFYLGMKLFGHEKTRRVSFENMQDNGIETQGIERVLDVGCGTGLNFPYFQQHFPNTSVDAFDLSPIMTENSRKAQRKVDIPIRIYRADALGMPFYDNSFDLTYLGFVLSSFEEPWRVMQEASRVTKPNCPIILCGSFESEYKLVRTFEQQVMQRFLEKAGWLTTKPVEELVKNTDVTYDKPIITDLFKTLKVYYLWNEK